MTTMKRYRSRVSSSARGELFNPLIYPFLFSTLSYGIGFLFLAGSDAVGLSSLHVAMYSIATWFPILWGAIAILTIVGGLTFLLFNIPPFGKITGLIGFMLWLFAGVVYALTGGWLTLFSVAMPNMFFWIWQYLSLSLFRREDAEDVASMKRYRAGDYK